VNPTPLKFRNGQIYWAMQILHETRLLLKQLNSLTPIEAVSCLSCVEVTHRTAVREVPGSSSGSVRVAVVAFIFWCVLIYCLNIIVSWILHVFWYSFYSFSIHTKLHNLWTIIRISRNGPSIFNSFTFLQSQY